MKIIYLAMIVCLTSCGSPSSGDRTASGSEQKKTKQRTPTLFDAQIDSMGKAEGVEDTVLKADQARKKQMQDL